MISSWSNTERLLLTVRGGGTGGEKEAYRGRIAQNTQKVIRAFINLISMIYACHILLLK